MRSIFRPAHLSSSAVWRAIFPPITQQLRTKPSLPLGAYAGGYRESFMGTATVRSDQGKLTIPYDASPMVGVLEHFHYDSFVATMPDAIMGKMPVTFRIGATGQVEGMTFPLGTTEWVKQK